jgi:hypothetical protein
MYVSSCYATVIQPQSDLVATLVETHPVGIKEADREPPTTAGRRIRFRAADSAPIEPNTLIGDLQTQPASPQTETQVNLLIGLILISMNDGVVQTFTGDQFHHKAVGRQTVGSHKGAQLEANGIHRLEA